MKLDIACVTITQKKENLFILAGTPYHRKAIGHTQAMTRAELKRWAGCHLDTDDARKVEKFFELY